MPRPKGGCGQSLWAFSNFVLSWDHSGIDGLIPGESKPGREFCSWREYALSWTSTEVQAPGKSTCVFF